MKNFGHLAMALAIGLLVVPGEVEGQTSPEGVPVVTVRMVDKSATEWAFEPADITVEPGTLVRFELAGAIPHNVEFKNSPSGTDLGNARMGPFLIMKGQTYEVMIDGRFAIGTHNYVCTPHEMMGMKGTITVQNSDPESRLEKN